MGKGLECERTSEGEDRTKGDPTIRRGSREAFAYGEKQLMGAVYPAHL